MGVPEQMEAKKDADEERFYLLFSEKGLHYRVHHLGASAGTLRVLALITALYAGKSAATMVAVEEPENYVHPTALHLLAEILRDASANTQVLLTTHSPLLLDFFQPEELCLVKRSANGTEVYPEAHPVAVRRALEESGVGLGAFYETKGFGE